MSGKNTPSKGLSVVKSQPASETSTGQQTEQAPDKQYVVSQKSMNILLNEIGKLPWFTANPIIAFVQENFTEVKSESTDK